MLVGKNLVDNNLLSKVKKGSQRKYKQSKDVRREMQTNVWQILRQSSDPC